MRTNQAIQLNGETALVQRIFSDYHAGRDEFCSMAILRWPDGHQTQHLLSELQDHEELYPLPLTSAANQVNGNFFDLPWPERKAAAFRYYPAALALATALGPLVQACDDSPASLGAAFANSCLVKSGWCDCGRANEAGHSEYYYCREDGKHGWFCPKCRGITQVG